YTFKNERLYNIFAISKTADHSIIYGASDQIVKLSRDFKLQKRIPAIVVKAFFAQENKLLVATNINVVVVDLIDFVIKDTIWNERATNVFASNDTVYIGTLNGLYCLFPGKPAV